ncbi:N/A [soil metagenome]
MHTLTNSTLVTVTFNNEPELAHFWSEFDKSFEWIVVDNNSSDDSVDIARELGARVITLDKNVGFSAANNIGVQAASGDTFIFCNPDVSVTSEGIAELSRIVEATGAVVGPQLLHPDGTLQENGRGAPYPHRKVQHMRASHGKASERYLRVAERGQLIDVVWLMGAAIAISRETFQRIGGWDEGFFIYYEDADICIRAWNDGTPVRLHGDVRWTHGWARETAGSFSWAAWKHEVRSASRFYRIHHSCVIPVGAESRRLREIDRLDRPSIEGWSKS